MIQAKECCVEYLEGFPVIDIRKPRVFWKVAGAEMQSAFEIEYAVNGGETISKGKTASSSMHTVIDADLKSRDIVRWRVRLWNGEDVPGDFSPWNFFEMGLLSTTDWRGRWIMGNYAHSSKKDVRYPVDHFRKKFPLEGKNFRKARLYITSCGLYEVMLNGKRVGDRVFAPGSTAFQKRAHYQVYDVADYLQEENTVTVELGDGFYASKTGCFGDVKVYGYEPKLLAQLEISMEDGSVQCISTDETWEWSNDGPITYADMKDGEDVDTRKSPSYSGKALPTVYTGIVCMDNNVAVREKEHFAVKRIIKCPDGHTVLDFGQNIAGYVEFCIQGKKGHKVSVILGEKLDENGNFTQKNICLKGDYQTERLQRVNFICDGTRQLYKPRFAVMGFQYALLLNWPEEIKAENFTAVAVYSDMKVTGEFSSSDAELDQIIKNTLWSMKGNFLDVPTDCPTRERAGWTGDAQLFFNTGNYLMDQAAFFRKWLQDVEDVQKKNGMIYNINPANPSKGALWEYFSVEGGVGWGDAFLRIPYFYWKRYGDDSLFKEHWTAIRACFMFYKKRLGRRNVFTLFRPGYGKYSKYLAACGKDFGEWTEPSDCAPSKMTDIVFPHPEEGTAYISHDALLMSEMAEHMGKRKEAGYYKNIHRNTRRAYQHYFVENAKETNRMAKYVRPLAFGLVSRKDKERYLDKVKTLNKERNYRVGTGFLSTPFVLRLLTEAGASDDGYKMLMNPDFGWVQQIHNGATTVWENWTNDASLNHYSKGACCEWLFDTICGIRLDGRENHFVIEPHLVSQLSHVSFAYDSVYGKVISGWTKRESGYTFHIEVPCNTEAEVILPDGSKKTCHAGSYDIDL